MKKLLIMLLLFPIYSYSQSIGEVIPLNIKSGMEKTVYEGGVAYSSSAIDSATIIRVYGGTEVVFAIDYIISYKKWERERLTWVTKYKAVGKNVFYDFYTKTYYFVVRLDDNFIIQLRNESSL